MCGWGGGWDGVRFDKLRATEFEGLLTSRVRDESVLTAGLEWEIAGARRPV